MPENVPQESINLKVRSTFTFGVDSGIAGFLSQESAAKLEGILDQDFMTVVAEQMHKTYEHTREWNNLKIPGVDELNALLFSSGYGDGSYVTYLGAGEQGQPVAVVVDCDVADGA
jgi:hypothetical protein